MGEGYDPLEIRINSLADLQAVKEARLQLQQLRNQCIEGSDVAKEMDKSLNSMNEAIENAGKKKLPEFNEELGHGEEGMHKLHMATRLFGGQLGEAGHLLHAFAMGFGELAIVLYTFKLLKDEAEEFAKGIEKGVAAASAFADSVKTSMQDAAAAVVAANAAWNDSIKHLNDEQDLATKALTNLIALQNQSVALSGQQTQAEAALTAAVLKRKVATGELTQEQADAMEAVSKANDEATKEALEEQEKQREIDEKRNRAVTAQAEIKAAEGKVPGLQGQSQFVGGNLNLANSELERRKGVADEAQKEADRFKGYYEASVRALATLRTTTRGSADWDAAGAEVAALNLSGHGGIEPGQIAAAKAKAEMMQKQADIAQGGFDSEKQHVADLKAQKDSIDADIKQQDDLIKARAKLIIQMNNEADQMAAELEQQKAAFKKRQETEAETRAVEAGTKKLERIKELLNKGGEAGGVGLNQNEHEELKRLLVGVGMISKDPETEKQAIRELTNEAINAARNARNAGADPQTALPILAEAVRELIELQNQHVPMTVQGKADLENMKRAIKLLQSQISAMPRGSSTG